MANANVDKVLTIDIGGGFIKLAEFDFGGGAITLTDFAVCPWSKPADGDSEAPSFKEVYSQMLQEHHFTAKRVRLCISAKNSFQRLIKLPAVAGSSAAVRRVVEYEAQQAVPYAMSEIEWDYQLIHHEWEETVTENDENDVPQEVVVKRSEFEAIFVAVKNEDIIDYTDAVESMGQEVLTVDVAPLALFNAAKAAQVVKDDECVLMVNIGAECSSLVISDRNNRVFIRSIPIAGNTITNQIASEFKVGLREAEELKLRYGFVALGGAYEDAESEIAAGISKIARMIMTRLHGEISRSINVWRAQHGGSAPERLLLSGGGSTMMYTTDFFQEKLRMPVDYLNTFSVLRMSEAVNKEELQKVAPGVQEFIGMAIRDVTTCPIDVSLTPRAILKQRELDRKKPYFYGMAALAILCLAIFTFGVGKLLDFDRKRVEAVKERVSATDRKVDEVNKVLGECNGAKAEYEEAVAMLNSRDTWFKLVNELQKMIPDTMWLIAVEPIGDAPEGENANPDGAGDGGGGDGGDGNVKVVNPFDVRNLIPNSNMTGGDGGGEGRSVETAPKRPDYKEAKKIRLLGYTLNINGQVRLEKALQRNLKDSQFFSEEWELKQNSKTNNLSRFEILLNLKEPLKK